MQRNVLRASWRSRSGTDRRGQTAGEPRSRIRTGTCVPCGESAAAALSAMIARDLRERGSSKRGGAATYAQVGRGRRGWPVMASGAVALSGKTAPEPTAASSRAMHRGQGGDDAAGERLSVKPGHCHLVTAVGAHNQASRPQARAFRRRRTGQCALRAPRSRGEYAGANPRRGLYHCVLRWAQWVRLFWTVRIYGCSAPRTRFITGRSAAY